MTESPIPTLRAGRRFAGGRVVELGDIGQAGVPEDSPNREGMF